MTWTLTYVATQCEFLGTVSRESSGIRIQFETGGPKTNKISFFYIFFLQNRWKCVRFYVRSLVLCVTRRGPTSSSMLTRPGLTIKATTTKNGLERTGLTRQPNFTPLGSTQIPSTSSSFHVITYTVCPSRIRFRNQHVVSTKTCSEELGRIFSPKILMK